MAENKDNPGPVTVAAAVIEEDGSVLIAQRGENVRQALKWEFPGGKMEPCETPEECVVREISEELGLSILVLDRFLTVPHRYDHGEILLQAYLCRLVAQGRERPAIENTCWVKTADLLNYDLAAADIPIARKLQRK